MRTKGNCWYAQKSKIKYARYKLYSLQFIHRSACVYNLNASSVRNISWNEKQTRDVINNWRRYYKGRAPLRRSENTRINNGEHWQTRAQERRASSLTRPLARAPRVVHSLSSAQSDFPASKLIDGFAGIAIDERNGESKKEREREREREREGEGEGGRKR